MTITTRPTPNKFDPIPDQAQSIPKRYQLSVQLSKRYLSGPEPGTQPIFADTKKVVASFVCVVKDCVDGFDPWHLSQDVYSSDDKQSG